MSEYKIDVRKAIANNLTVGDLVGYIFLAADISIDEKLWNRLPIKMKRCFKQQPNKE